MNYRYTDISHFELTASSNYCISVISVQLC